MWQYFRGENFCTVCNFWWILNLMWKFHAVRLRSLVFLLKVCWLLLQDAKSFENILTSTTTLARHSKNCFVEPEHCEPLLVALPDLWQQSVKFEGKNNIVWIYFTSVYAILHKKEEWRGVLHHICVVWRSVWTQCLDRAAYKCDRISENLPFGNIGWFDIIIHIFLEKQAFGVKLQIKNV